MARSHAPASPEQPPSRDATFLRALVSANDTTRALQVAVDHVVAVLDCEVSWAGLIEGDRLIMGAHRGLKTTEMASAWQLKVGEGIGGRVASERRSYVSRDYLHDSRRVPLMKRLIDTEGIQATLTVPLLMADATLGVLYAAQRRPYPWSEQEIHVTEQVGRDLAIRLRQLDVDGRLDQRGDRAEARYRRSQQTLASGARLAATLRETADLPVALEELGKFLDGRVALLRHDGEALAYGGTAPEDAQDHGDVPIPGSTGLRLSVQRPRSPERPTSAGDPLAQTATVPPKTVEKPDETTRAALDLAAGLLGLHMLCLAERVRALEQVYGDIADQLLTGRIPDPGTLRVHLSLLGHDAAQAQAWVVADSGDDSTLLDEFGEQLAESLRTITVTMRDGLLVAIVDLTELEPEEAREHLESLLVQRHHRGLTVGIGRIASELTDYAMSYDQARAAVEMGRRRGYPQSVLDARELGILAMASVPSAYLRSTVQDVLGPLISADAARGTDLVETLRTYLANDRHIPSTADALHIHYNTVRNRVARIEELLAVEIRDVDARFSLETALRMHALVWPATDPPEGVTS